MKIKYSDIPFRITNCISCDVELPAWQKLCPPCAKNARDKDLEKTQEMLCRKYLKSYKGKPRITKTP